MTEEWRPVPGYEGLYSVSDQGRVRAEAKEISCRNGVVRSLEPRMLSPVPVSSTGYLKVRLVLDGAIKAFLVHRLVLMAFVRLPMPGEEGCHYPDPDRANNRLENLMWGTRSINQIQRVEMGNHHNALKTECSQGHPFNEQNTYITGAGHRQCRTCARDRMRRKRAGS